MRPIHKPRRSLSRVGRVAMVAAVAVGGVLAGCGDESDGDGGEESAEVDATDADTAESVEAGGTESTEGDAAGAGSVASAASSAPVESTPSSDPAESGGSADTEGSGDVDEFCASLERIDELDPNADGEQVVDEFRQLDENAPEEVADATALLVTIVELSLSAFELEGDEQQEALDELAASEDDFNQAAVDFETFAVEACPDLSEAIFGGSPTTNP